MTRRNTLFALLTLLVVTNLGLPGAQAGAPRHTADRLILIKSVKISPTPLHNHKPAFLTMQVVPGTSCTLTLHDARGANATAQPPHRTLASNILGYIQFHWTAQFKALGTAKALLRCRADKLTQNATATFKVAR